MTQPDAARVERGPITEVKRFALGMADLLERQGFTIAAAELRRLHQQELANIEWQEKTAWVQKTAKPDELGMHRADVMSRRLGRLKNQRDALLAVVNKLEYSSDGYIKRYPEESEVSAAIAKAEENT